MEHQGIKKAPVLNDQGSFIFFQLVFNSEAFFNTHNVVRSLFGILLIQAL